MLRVFFSTLSDVREPDTKVVLQGEELRYLMLARRSRVGDACELFDGGGLVAAATMVAIAPTQAELRVALPRHTPALRPRLVVLQSLIKGDRMDVCLEKLVETGADDILLVNAERAVVKMAADKSAARHGRWAAQVLAAARQSERAYLPTIDGPFELAEAIGKLPTDAFKCATDPTGTPWPTAATNAAISAAATLAIAVGPEGGFSPQEYAQLHAAGFVSHAISPHILRAETAGPIAVALARATALQ
ncbi:MAG: 16S rRNA (uracil(1498)-N(3))-methyltransferase [Myxococcales bacterium]|nr:16S rRNA (uracil(1498)-N(3))-methyltransferase [Myxococcales bacterium]